MGLDIVAYSHLRHVGLHLKDRDRNEGEPGGLDDYCYYDNHVEAYAYDSFPLPFRGIPIISERPLSRGDRFIKGGCFEVTPETVEHHFRAGSYSGYGMWRADLRAQFNPDLDKDGPFYELIDFADNEGCIGPEAAKDLLADFREHATRYVAPGNWGPVYQDWTRAFELAADGGLVLFC